MRFFLSGLGENLSKIIFVVLALNQKIIFFSFNIRFKDKEILKISFDTF